MASVQTTGTVGQTMSTSMGLRSLSDNISQDTVISGAVAKHVNCTQEPAIAVNDWTADISFTKEKYLVDLENLQGNQVTGQRKDGKEPLLEVNNMADPACRSLVNQLGQGWIVT